MRVVQTRNKRLVFGILLSALMVGVMLTIGQVPLAVSQPVTIPVGKISGTIPMDAANPIWETVPGVVVPLSGQTITTPMHPNISVKTVMVKMATSDKIVVQLKLYSGRATTSTRIRTANGPIWRHR